MFSLSVSLSVILILFHFNYYYQERIQSNLKRRSNYNSPSTSLPSSLSWTQFSLAFISQSANLSRRSHSPSGNLTSLKARKASWSTRARTSSSTRSTTEVNRSNPKAIDSRAFTLRSSRARLPPAPSALLGLFGTDPPCSPSALLLTRPWV